MIVFAAIVLGVMLLAGVTSMTVGYFAMPPHRRPPIPPLLKVTGYTLWALAMIGLILVGCHAIAQFIHNA